LLTYFVYHLEDFDCDVLLDSVGLGDRLNDISKEYGCASLRLETWTGGVEAMRVLITIILYQKRANRVLLTRARETSRQC
jgi:hypothetical protein